MSALYCADFRTENQGPPSVKGGCRFRPPLSISPAGVPVSDAKPAGIDRLAACYPTPPRRIGPQVQMEQRFYSPKDDFSYCLRRSGRRTTPLRSIREADVSDFHRRELKRRPPSATERTSTITIVAKHAPSMLSAIRLALRPRGYGRPIAPAISSTPRSSGCRRRPTPSPLPPAERAAGGSTKVACSTPRPPATAPRTRRWGRENPGRRQRPLAGPIRFRRSTRESDDQADSIDRRGTNPTARSCNGGARTRKMGRSSTSTIRPFRRTNRGRGWTT